MDHDPNTPELVAVWARVLAWIIVFASCAAAYGFVSEVFLDGRLRSTPWYQTASLLLITLWVLPIFWIVAFTGRPPKRWVGLIGAAAADGSPMRLLITAVPPGEAPLWVREKWVGLELPLAQRYARPLTLRTGGVLTGPKDLLSELVALFRGRLARETGFVVDAQSAVDTLASSSPEAAAWWRDNVPHIVRPNRHFIFQQHVAQVKEANK